MLQRLRRNTVNSRPCDIPLTVLPILLYRFQAKGMDIGVADESLNGIPYEESSESEDEVETEETEGRIMQNFKRKHKIC